MDERLPERIARQIIPEPNSGCWLWLGCVNEHGYGIANWGGHAKADRVHRIIWRLLIGPLTRVQHLLHRCDTPACCNPDHLFIGNPRINAHDKMRKGRWGGHSKITEETADKIRNTPGTCRGLAAIFGVSYEHIADIKAGRRRQQRVWQ